MVAEDLSRQLLRCTVRIDTATGGGTGFITKRRHGSKNGIFLVTNRHVVAGTDHMRLAFLTAAGNQGPRPPKTVLVDFPNVRRNCVFHDDARVDIAVLPFGGVVDDYSKKGTPLLFKTIPSNIYLTESKSRELSAIEEVIIVGYPRLLRDEHTLTPIVRRGITATPIDQSFQGMRGFLVDAAVFEGSSGSPVFIYNVGSYPVPDGIAMGHRIVFLGILAKLVSGPGDSPSIRRNYIGAASTPVEVPGTGDSDPAMTKYTNLGLVFTAQCVHEAITRMIDERRA